MINIMQPQAGGVPSIDAASALAPNPLTQGAPTNVPIHSIAPPIQAPQQHGILDSLEGMLQGLPGSGQAKGSSGGFDISSILGNSGGGDSKGGDSGFMSYAKYIPAALQFAAMLA